MLDKSPAAGGIWTHNLWITRRVALPLCYMARWSFGSSQIRTKKSFFYWQSVRTDPSTSNRNRNRDKKPPKISGQKSEPFRKIYSPRGRNFLSRRLPLSSFNAKSDIFFKSAKLIGVSAALINGALTTASGGFINRPMLVAGFKLPLLLFRISFWSSLEPGYVCCIFRHLLFSRINPLVSKPVTK